MRFSDIFAASLVAPLVAAHGGVPGAPKIFGLGELRQRRSVDSRASRRAAQPHLNARQGGNADNRCGAEFGGAVCAPGYCCSSAGWCGQGQDYCQAPDCQFQYGPGCDANQLPSGGSTRPIPRPQLGNVPYGGEGIYACNVPGTVAITYDDGPYIYTNGVLDQFAAYGFKATFFITGINIGKGAIDDESKPWPAVIRRMVAEGHQVASHTWSHQDLGAITKEQRIDQMVKNEMAFSNILGKFPTYMRPPYSSCGAGTGCPEDLADLGYVVSYFDLDTDDYNNVVPEKIQNAKNNFANAVNPSNPANTDWLAIAHDIHQQTAQNLTGFMLDTLVAKGYRGVTMGECMGEPEANWYRAANGRVPTSSATLPTPSNTGVSSTVTSSAPTATATGVTVDGQCGVANGLSCTGFPQGTCCSQYGWCGSSVDHCGTGCQSGFGTCGSSGGSSSAASSAGSTATSSAPTSAPTGPPSPDGTCGGTQGYSCIGFAQGECCSQYGWCGSSTDHCGTGCNPLFGNCGSSSGTKASQTSTTPPTSNPPAQQSSTAPPTSSRPAQLSSSTRATSTIRTTTAPSSKPTTTTSTKTSTKTSTTSTAAPTPTGQKTRDGTCGGRNGYNCIGFFFGECCNARGTSTGFCSSTKDACEKNCNPLYGNCGSKYTLTSWRGW